MPSLIDRWFEYYREVVKYTLNDEPVPFDQQDAIREVLRRVIESYEQRSFDDTLLMLGVLRGMVFPEVHDPLIMPEQLHPRFVDFLLDEEMWSQIRSMQRNEAGFLSKALNEINIPYIVNDLKEMVEQDTIFVRQDDGRE
jgi:hypothetical protein